MHIGESVSANFLIDICDISPIITSNAETFRKNLETFSLTHMLISNFLFHIAVIFPWRLCSHETLHQLYNLCWSELTETDLYETVQRLLCISQREGKTFNATSSICDPFLAMRKICFGCLESCDSCWFCSSHVHEMRSYRECNKVISRAWMQRIQNYAQTKCHLNTWADMKWMFRPSGHFISDTAQAVLQ